MPRQTSDQKATYAIPSWTALGYASRRNVRSRQRCFQCIKDLAFETMVPPVPRHVMRPNVSSCAEALESSTSAGLILSDRASDDARAGRPYSEVIRCDVAGTSQDCGLVLRALLRIGAGCASALSGRYCSATA